MMCEHGVLSRQDAWLESADSADLRRRSAPSQAHRRIRQAGLHNPEIQKSYYFVDTGIIAGNVYLCVAAHDPASWFHNCEKHALVKKLARVQSRKLYSRSRSAGQRAPRRGREAHRRYAALEFNVRFLQTNTKVLGAARPEPNRYRPDLSLSHRLPELRHRSVNRIWQAWRQSVAS